MILKHSSKTQLFTTENVLLSVTVDVVFPLSEEGEMSRHKTGVKNTVCVFMTNFYGYAQGEIGERTG